MDIVIIAQYLNDISNITNNNSRFIYLAKILSQNKENKIEIITSDFNHLTKKYFKKIGKILNIKITALHESGYSKNVSLKRIISHKELSKNIKEYLNNRVKPDIVYCALPSLDVGYETAKYCKKNDIKFIVDIQDLWPEAFKMAFNIPILSDMFFYPMQKIANYIYASADKIVAVSDTYRDRGLKVNKKDTQGLTVFLGTDLNDLDKKLQYQDITYKKKKNEFWIGYLGTIGNSYDIETSLKAIAQVQKEICTIKFILLGDGPLLNKFKKMTVDLNVNAVFLGRKDYIEAMKILSQCDITLNPIVKNSKASIINKVGDYAALGLPVINSLQNEEYQELLEKYNAGINIPCKNYKAMADAIVFLIKNQKSRIDMGEANRRLAQDLFDRNCTYKKILQLIEEFNEI